MSPDGTVRARSKSKSSTKAASKRNTSAAAKSRGSAKAQSKTSAMRTKPKAGAKSRAKRAVAATGDETYNGIGSAAVAAKTGKGWQDWFAILDRSKASTWPHKQIATFLYDEHAVPGWWCQMITVGYEQARGLRVKHQKADGFAASASKTIGAPLEKLFDAWSKESARKSWLGGAAVAIRKSTPFKSLRMTWDDGSSVSVNFYKKGPDKSQVAIDHEKLRAAADVARMKRVWGAALNKLKTKLEAN